MVRGREEAGIGPERDGLTSKKKTKNATENRPLPNPDGCPWCHSVFRFRSSRLLYGLKLLTEMDQKAQRKHVRDLFEYE